MDTGQALVHLNETERDCVLRYLSLLAEHFSENLAQIWLFGSAARGDMWPGWMPMHSDIDLLVLTAAPVPEEVQEELINATHPLFLECGRQISPSFWTITRFHSPEDDRTREFAGRIREEGQVIYEQPRAKAQG